MSYGYGISSSSMIDKNGGKVATTQDDNCEFYKPRKSWGIQECIDNNDNIQVINQDSAGVDRPKNAATTQYGKGTWHEIIINPFKFDKEYVSYNLKEIYIEKLLLGSADSDGNVTQYEVYKLNNPAFAGSAQYDPYSAEWTKVADGGVLPLTPGFSTVVFNEYTSLIRLRVLSSSMNYTEVAAIKAIGDRIRYVPS